MTLSLANGAIGLLVATTWALAGWRLLPQRYRAADPLLVWTTSLALGAGMTSLLVTLLAGAKQFSLETAGLVAGGECVLAAWGAWSWRRHVRHPVKRTASNRGATGWAPRFAQAAILLTIAATFLATLAPPSSMDATVYHLRIARTVVEKGHWLELPDVVQSYQPLYVQMLFAEGMAIGNDVIASLIHWVLGVAAVGAAGAWCRHLGARATWGMLVFTVAALFCWESTSAFIDLGLTLFTALALLWAARDDDGWEAVLLSGLFAGLAAGSKLTGGASVLLAAGVALVSRRPHWRSGCLKAGAIIALGFALALPWYLRNVMFTGNPVYPVANTLFGLPSVALASSTYGYGRDLWHLLTSPFDLIWRGAPFDQGFAMGPAYLAFIPLGAAVAIRLRTGRFAVAMLAGWWIFWFYSSPQTRLILPILPVGAALAAVGVEVGLRHNVRLVRWSSGGTLIVASLIGLSAAGASVAACGRAAVGLESRQAFLDRASWHHPAYSAVNRLLHGDARLAVIGANNLYYVKPPASVIHPEPSSLDELTARGFTHVLDIRSCESGPTGLQMPADLWRGRYEHSSSRLTGGSRVTVCATLGALAPGSALLAAN